LDTHVFYLTTVPNYIVDLRVIGLSPGNLTLTTPLVSNGTSHNPNTRVGKEHNDFSFTLSNIAYRELKAGDRFKDKALSTYTWPYHFDLVNGLFTNVNSSESVWDYRAIGDIPYSDVIQDLHPLNYLNQHRTSLNGEELFTELLTYNKLYDYQFFTTYNQYVNTDGYQYRPGNIDRCSRKLVSRILTELADGPLNI